MYVTHFGILSTVFPLETKGRSYPSPHNNDEGPNHKNKSDERTRREDNEDIKLPIHALCQHPVSLNIFEEFNLLCKTLQS